MAKPQTELGQRCPPPPYTRWDQRGKPVLLSYLKLINGKRLCLSLETEDVDIRSTPRRHSTRKVRRGTWKARLDSRSTLQSMKP